MPTVLAPAPTKSEAVDTAPACLYCEGRDLDVLYTGVRDRLEYVPGERTWWTCRGCGSAVLVPLPKAEDLAAFYPPVYSFTPELGKRSGLARVLAGLEYHLFFRPQYLAQVRQVVRAVGPGSGKKLLDVGCGRGLRLLEFRRLGYDVHGLDLQPDVVRYLTDELRIPAVCAEVGAASEHYPAGSFDVVTAYYLMEHIPDVVGFLAACHRLLKPGGVLAVAIPFVDSWQAGLFGKRWINVTEAPRHLTLPTQKGTTAAFRRPGFDAVEFVPDSVLNCAGAFASSAVTGATLTHAYGKGGAVAMLKRFVGAAVMFGSLPFCLAENYAARRMPMGTVFARKTA